MNLLYLFLEGIMVKFINQIKEKIGFSNDLYKININRNQIQIIDLSLKPNHRIEHSLTKITEEKYILIGGNSNDEV
jgi:hypothetical protein